MHKRCECGHSWWEHLWNDKRNDADGCSCCECRMYSEKGTGCYWIPELLYEILDEVEGITYNAHRIHIKTWIGDEVLNEDKRSKIP